MVDKRGQWKIGDFDFDPSKNLADEVDALLDDKVTKNVVEDIRKALANAKPHKPVVSGPGAPGGIPISASRAAVHKIGSALPPTSAKGRSPVRAQ